MTEGVIDQTGNPAAGWSMAWRIARRELRGGIAGFRIFILCLMIGVAAIAAVRSVSSAVLNSLSDDGRAILGGDMVMRSIYIPAEPEQQSFLDVIGTVSNGVEMRAMARVPGATGLGAGAATLVELKAVDDLYPLYGEVELQGGGDFREAVAQQADGSWGAVVEEGALIRLNLEIGDRVVLGQADMTITDVIAREPDRASGGTFTLGPRMMVDLAAMDDTGLMQEGSLIYFLYRLDLNDGVSVDEARRAIADNVPAAGWRVRDFRNASPALRNFIERLTMFLTLTGLTALLVGGVGVGNAVKGYLDGKSRTIAMLKCVGAPGSLIFRAYLLQVMALASIGIGLGLVVGAIAPILVGQALEGILPIRISIGFDGIGLILAGLFGYLVALTFTVWPLGYARDVPAVAIFREMFADNRKEPHRRYVLMTGALALTLGAIAVLTAEHQVFAFAFVSGAVLILIAFNAAGGLITNGAKALGRPRSPTLRLALTNLHRPGSPAPTVVLSLGLGLTVLVTIALIEGNFARAVNDEIPKDAPTFFFVDIQPDQLEPFRNQVESEPGVTDFRATPMMRGRIVEVNGTPAREAVVNEDEAWVLNGDRGVTYSAEPANQGETWAGEWWDPSYVSGRDGPPLVSVEESIAEAFGIGPGDEITVNILGRDLTATIAHVREVNWGTVQINFTLIYAPGLLDNAPQTFLATLKAPPESEAAIQRGVPANFPNISMVRVRDAIDTVNTVLGNIATAVRVTAAVTLVAGTLVLAGAIAAGHRRRIYDAVVLKVLGATRWTVLRAFLTEYGVLGISTALIAGVAGTITAYLVLTGTMGMAWTFLPMAVINTILIASVITIGLGFLGTWHALGQKPAPLLRND
ncbi:MAG: ABC transporter permease [Alphaproteobacteria bacterium]|nr:ABC transporter permease [Alphaproteobacteria bacterium SS10]